MKKIKIKEIINILGIEKENIKDYNTKKLKEEFNHLYQKYQEEQIWLIDDVGIYIKGKIVDTTDYLAAVIF